jgi:hypothetical protein
MLKLAKKLGVGVLCLSALAAPSQYHVRGSEPLADCAVAQFPDYRPCDPYSSYVAAEVQVQRTLRGPSFVVREKHLKPGDWRTVETFVNSSAKIIFLGPAGCRVKLVSFPGTKGNQRQVLDGVNPKIVKVSGLRGLFGRVQVRIPDAMTEGVTVRYVVWPGELILGPVDIQKVLDLIRSR